MNISKSQKLYSQALQFMPGGVNSPVRAFKNVGKTPLFIEKAKGSRIYDADGNEYIDYVCSWGPNILGQAYPEVIEAMDLESKRLYKIIDDVVAYTGQKAEKIAVAQTLAQQLERFVERPDRLRWNLQLLKKILHLWEQRF